ncbi:MAG: response regulator transcription factor [Bacteroidetes bacterium]|nr:response regulator transcription factor [Bacteroidota bacterium]
MKTKILYIEDEKYLGRIVSETLEKQGYEVIWETDGAKVIKHLHASFDPNICILDIMLPHVDGYELCHQIKALKPAMPVIFLTAKTETADLVKGFEAGGTDYMRKPFSIEELIVRIENQMAISNGGENKRQHTPEELKLGKYTYYPQRYELKSPIELISLSHREGEILTLLTGSVNRVIDRKQLLISVWGDDSFFNSRNLDVYIRKLRDHFKHDTSLRIQTLKGKGYLFMVPS